MTRSHLSTFVQNHRFKDTAALFIVFLSFNHFYLLCLLLFFIAATQQLDFLPNFLILSTLSKKPTRPVALTATVSGDAYITRRSSHFSGQPQGYHNQSTLTSGLPIGGVNKHAHLTTAGSNSGNINNNRHKSFSGFKNSAAVRHWSWLNTTLYLGTEFGMATLLLVYAPSYFVAPIETLAISILVAFLVHDPRDSLNCATACTILYAVTLNIIKLLTLAPLGGTGNNFKPGGNGIVFGTTGLSSRLPLIGTEDVALLYTSSSTPGMFSGPLSMKTPVESQWWLWLVRLKLVRSLWEEYIRQVCYYLSFHIVVYQFTHTIITVPSSVNNSLTCFDFSDKFTDFNFSSASDVDNDVSRDENILNGTTVSMPRSLPIPKAPNVGNNKERTDINTDECTNKPSGNNKPASNDNARPVTLRDNNSNSTSVSVNGPYFSSLVTNVKAYRAFPSDTNKGDIGNIDEARGFTIRNDTYELLVDLQGQENEHRSQTSDFETKVSNTTNLEVFIRYLFSMRVRTLLPPLWSIFTTLRAANLERRFLEITDFHKCDGSSSMNNELLPLFSAASGGGDTDGNNVTKGTDIAIDSMALVTQRDKNIINNSNNNNNNNSDFDRLNIAPEFARNSIFRRLDYEYKVRISNIGTHSLSFHIKNLKSDDLLILVNGLIWSEIGEEEEHYGDTQDKSKNEKTRDEGYKSVVVSGLVPMYSYNIQIVSRLDGVNNLLIAEFAVRTRGVGDSGIGGGGSSNGGVGVGGSNVIDGEQDADDLYDIEDLDEEEEGLPSHYRKRFSSPFLTLRHSILTTNTNLDAERTKLKKTKKEVNKQLGMLRQEIEYYKGRIEQSSVTGEKNLSKVENLKTALQQNKLTLERLESSLEQLSREEQELEVIHLERRNIHLKKELDYSRFKTTLEEQHTVLDKKVQSLKSECSQLATRREKLDIRNKRILSDMEQTGEMLKSFVQRKEKEREQRRQMRIIENNELQQVIKSLEQQIDSVTEENENMRPMAGSS